jgi:hypothetical protein
MLCSYFFYSYRAEGFEPRTALPFEFTSIASNPSLHNNVGMLYSYFFFIHTKLMGSNRERLCRIVQFIPLKKNQHKKSRS